MSKWKLVWFFFFFKSQCEPSPLCVTGPCYSRADFLAVTCKSDKQKEGALCISEYKKAAVFWLSAQKKSFICHKQQWKWLRFERQKKFWARFPSACLSVSNKRHSVVMAQTLLWLTDRRTFWMQYNLDSVNSSAHHHSSRFHNSSSNSYSYVST